MKKMKKFFKVITLAVSSFMIMGFCVSAKKVVSSKEKMENAVKIVEKIYSDGSKTKELTFPDGRVELHKMAESSGQLHVVGKVCKGKILVFSAMLDKEIEAIQEREDSKKKDNKSGYENGMIISKVKYEKKLKDGDVSVGFEEMKRNVEMATKNVKRKLREQKISNKEMKKYKTIAMKQLRKQKREVEDDFSNGKIGEDVKDKNLEILNENIKSLKKNEFSFSEGDVKNIRVEFEEIKSEKGVKSNKKVSTEKSKADEKIVLKKKIRPNVKKTRS